MPQYKIKTSETPEGFEVGYNFASTQEAKRYFCNKIIGRNYDGGDGFAVSSKYFEEMGVLLSSYSNEKCYVIKSFTQSIDDLERWSEYKSELSGKTNRKILGERFFDSINKKCTQLFTALKVKVEDSSKIAIPEICCEADKAVKSKHNLVCVEDYFAYMDQIGCSKNEGVCDGGGLGGYTIFLSDEL